MEASYTRQTEHNKGRHSETKRLKGANADACILINLRHHDGWIQCLHAVDPDERENRGQKRRRC